MHWSYSVERHSRFFLRHSVVSPFSQFAAVILVNHNLSNITAVLLVLYGLDIRTCRFQSLLNKPCCLSHYDWSSIYWLYINLLYTDWHCTLFSLSLCYYLLIFNILSSVLIQLFAAIWNKPLSYCIARTLMVDDVRWNGSKWVSFHG